MEPVGVKRKEIKWPCTGEIEVNRTPISASV